MEHTTELLLTLVPCFRELKETSYSTRQNTVADCQQCENEQPLYILSAAPCASVFSAVITQALSSTCHKSNRKTNTTFPMCPCRLRYPCEVFS